MTTVEILFTLATALAAGLLMSRLAKLIDLPSVTAYLVAGVLVGPFCLGRLGVPGIGFTSDTVGGFELISDVALGFIAFTMGNEFRLTALRKTGKAATFVAVFQALSATVFVDVALIVAHFIIPDVISLSAAIILGAIATATAPAATLMVINQYKAKGELTSILMPVVALDDAVGLVVFSVSFGIAKAIVSGSADIVSILVNPLIEIVASLVVGVIVGIAFTWLERFFHSRSKRLSMSVTFVLLTVGISLLKFDLPGGVKIGFSSLLSCMMLGTVFCNICDFSEELMDRLDRWTGPLFILFFVLSGAQLELSVFTSFAVVGIGLLYILARSSGKYFGARWSARMMGCSDNVCRHLGITLLPQAGVALGMCVTMRNAVGVFSDAEISIVCNITLFAILVYEIIGPSLTKSSLIASGDIVRDGAKSARENVHGVNKIEEHKAYRNRRRAEKQGAAPKENENTAEGGNTTDKK